MKSEYLIFNLLVLLAPLALSFDKRVHFKQYWPFVFPAILLGGGIHVLWDYLAAGQFWFFNTKYILGIRIGKLPFEELLFFITVPYAVLFTWEVFLEYFPNRYRSLETLRIVLTVLGLGLAVAIFVFRQWTYTSLVFLIFSVAMILDFILLRERSVWNQSLWYWFLLLFFVMILIANGYLTARPVVMYSPLYRSGLHILTIPAEDFLFGMSHLMFVVTFYTFFKERRFAM